MDKIREKILSKRNDIDSQLLEYMTNYFSVVVLKGVIPRGITLDELIDNALFHVKKIEFYDENSEMYQEMGPDVKGCCDPDVKTLFIRGNLPDELKEMVVYHELHHAVQTNPLNNGVGINQVMNIGRLIMEAQTQWFAEEVYKIVHNTTFEEREIPSEDLRMVPGNIVVSSLHNYEMYDNLLTKLAIILDVPKEFFVLINYLGKDNEGLKLLKKKYNKKKIEKKLELEFDHLLYMLDYIYVVDLIAYNKGENQKIILRGKETKERYWIYPRKAERLSLERQKDYIDTIDVSLVLSLIENGYDFELFSNYIIDNGNRKLIKRYIINDVQR